MFLDFIYFTIGGMGSIWITSRLTSAGCPAAPGAP